MGEYLETFWLNSGEKQECPLPLLLFIGVSQCNNAKKYEYKNWTEFSKRIIINRLFYCLPETLKRITRKTSTEINKQK